MIHVSRWVWREGIFFIVVVSFERHGEKPSPERERERRMS